MMAFDGGKMKRGLDIILSLIAIVLLLPLMALASIVIHLDSQGPVIFVQRRIGLDDKEFLMYKFRTMVVGTPEVATDKLVNSQGYITKVGYYLRKYSIDEIPQLFNVLKGDMSFVGPRPALYNQYDLRQMRNELGIDKIRPGITGWAQVNGRDKISLEEKVCFDSYYLEHKGIFLDCEIIFLTVFSISSGQG